MDFLPSTSFTQFSLFYLLTSFPILIKNVPAHWWNIAQKENLIWWHDCHASITFYALFFGMCYHFVILEIMGAEKRQGVSYQVQAIKELSVQTVLTFIFWTADTWHSGCLPFLGFQYTASTVRGLRSISYTNELHDSSH